MVKSLKNKLVNKFGSRAVKVVGTAGIVGATAVPAAFAEAGASSLATDAGTVTTMATSVMGLFTIYPLNIILAMGLLGGVIGVVAKLKRRAK